jgi:hypothetical protein
MTHIRYLKYLSTVISFMTFSFVQTALGSTHLCSDLFPVHQDSVTHQKSIVPEDFLQASHEFFVATLSQASKTTSPLELKVYFSKLSAIAKEHQLSQSEFLNWQEQAKLSFVRKYFLESQPEDQMLILDRSKLSKLDTADIQMKASFMPEFLSSKDFLKMMDELPTPFERTGESSLKQHNSSYTLKLHFMNVIRHLPEYPLIQEADEFNPIIGVIINSLPTQDPKFLNIIYDYSSANNTREYLWSLQRKINLPYSTTLAELKSIAHAPIQISSPNDFDSLFPFYNPETNTISLAVFFKSEGDLKVRWISSIPNQDTETAMELPHLSSNDETYLLSNLTKFLERHPSSSYILFYTKKLKAFSFFYNLPWTEVNSSQVQNVRILTNAYMITTDPSKEISISDDFQISPWLSDPKLKYSLTEDGHILKLQITGQIKKELAQSPHINLPPPHIEGLTLHTRYFLLDPQSEFQLQSIKKAKP